jgi:hypothetical protein
MVNYLAFLEGMGLGGASKKRRRSTEQIFSYYFIVAKLCMQYFLPFFVCLLKTVTNCALGKKGIFSACKPFIKHNAAASLD